MKGESIGSSSALLRADFDRAFAEPREAQGATLQSFLCVRVGEDVLAFRLSDVLSVHKDTLLAPLPTPLSELLGLAGIRGALCPVYDLAALLGYPARQAPRWLALTQATPSVGLAFDELAAQVRVTPDAVSDEGDSARSEHLRGVLRIDGRLHPIIHTPSLLSVIARRAAPHGTPKE